MSKHLPTIDDAVPGKQRAADMDTAMTPRSKRSGQPHEPPHAAHGTPRRAFAIWVFLIAATGLAWAVGERGMGGPAIVTLLFGLAFIKGSLVILDYMAIRHAPLFWRGLTLGWLGAVCILIGLAYWKGMNL